MSFSSLFNDLSMALFSMNVDEHFPVSFGLCITRRPCMTITINVTNPLWLTPQSFLVGFHHRPWISRLHREDVYRPPPFDAGPESRSTAGLRSRLRPGCLSLLTPIFPPTISGRGHWISWDDSQEILCLTDTSARLRMERRVSEDSRGGRNACP